jgi:hypothetical protein
MKINIHHSAFPPQYFLRKVHPLTKKNIEKWTGLNRHLDVTQRVWVINEAREFLDKFGSDFGLDILKWFDNEADGRYKSDIWRLCVLYQYGGIYIDIDQEPLTSMKDYIDFDTVDFVGCSNMGLHNISNGFIYAKIGSEIIRNNIHEIIRRYETNGPRGGCCVMGAVITDLINGEPFKMPLGGIEIGNEKCLFLHEIGDETLPDGTQAFYNSFGVYSNDDTVRVMNSRYSTYHNDRHHSQVFVEV